MLSPLPSGSIFGVSGMGCFSSSDDDEDLSIYCGLCKLLPPAILKPHSCRCARNAAKIPSGNCSEFTAPTSRRRNRERLIHIQTASFTCGRELLSLDETCLHFNGFSNLSPWESIAGDGNSFETVAREFVSIRVQHIASNQSKINDGLFNLAAIPAAARVEIDNETSFSIPQPDCRVLTLAQNVISFALGTCFGRWQVTPFADVPMKPTPCFDPLPVNTEAELKNGTVSEHVNSILVDDADHTDDIVRHLREVLETVWNVRADTIEKEACRLLG